MSRRKTRANRTGSENQPLQRIIEPLRTVMASLRPVIKNRMFLVVAGSILFMGVVGGILGVILLGDKTDTTVPDELSDTEIAHVLPQQTRLDEDYVEEDSDGFWDIFGDYSGDPFGGPLKLTGTMYSDRGGEMAIISSGGTSHIVTVGDYIDDLWAVLRISEDMVVLRSTDLEVSLYFDQPPTTRSVDYRDFENDLEDDLEEEEGA